MPYDGRTSPSRRVTKCLVKRSVELMRGWTAPSKFSPSPASPAIRRPNLGRCDSHQKQSVADPAFGQAYAIWPSPDVALCLDDGPRWALMHHDGRVCATLELRRATRLGPQRAKGMLSRVCCGQKQWLSWSADGTDGASPPKTLRLSCQANHLP